MLKKKNDRKILNANIRCDIYVQCLNHIGKQEQLLKVRLGEVN